MDDMDLLMAEIQSQYIDSLQSIADRVKQLFQEAIQETIYDYTDFLMTGWYQRTHNFENAVDTKLNIDGSLLVYIDTSKLNYYSYVNYERTDNNVSDIVPWLLEEGHHSGNSNDLYHNYNGRGYLENALAKIHSEYPTLILTIVNEQPQF